MAQMKNHKEKKTRNSKARATLFAAVLPQIFIRIMTMKSAFEVWSFLKKEYKRDERIKEMRILDLIREFKLQKMKDSNTVKEYSDILLNIANKVVKDQEEEDQLFVVSYFASDVSSESWPIDSGCTNHMIFEKELFKELKPTRVKKLIIGNGNYIPAKEIGTIAIETQPGTKTISDVLYVANFDQNLLTLGQLVEKSFKLYFEDNYCLIKDPAGQDLFKVKMRGKSFSLDPREEKQMVYSTKENVAELWHKRLRHYHYQGLVKMQKLKMVENLSDLEVNSTECHAYNLSEVDGVFWKFKNLVKNQSGCNIQALRSDNGKEYTLAKFISFCEDAEKDPKWRVAMKDELNMIEKNHTGKLVKRPKDRKVIRHKARLIVKGYAQVFGIDFSDTFAHVSKLETIILLLVIAAQKDWKVFQLDVKSAFLNGFLEEKIYVEQPEGFIVKGNEYEVYQLRKALKSTCEATLYIKDDEINFIVVSLYVDDMLVTGSNDELVKKFKEDMHHTFEMTDLGEMVHFPSMEIKQKVNEVFICQKKYAGHILKKFRMENCKETIIPMCHKEKLSKNDEAEKVDKTLYKSMVDCLMYLTITRPDILYNVSLLSRFTNFAIDTHFRVAKRVMRYVKGTLNFGIKFYVNQKYVL
ncbi:uncharacterized protein [Nicotiana sylvestris]|uniref:uncharacterized protein n=1 Tax=Nicotiana sylvestris TaxID=4096 RepID=UPI00388C9BDE